MQSLKKKLFRFFFAAEVGSFYWCVYSRGPRGSPYLAIEKRN